MSKIGFRRELLGFNRDDVIEYIKKSQCENEQREKELIASLDKLNARNAKLLEKLEELPVLEAKLKLSEETVEKLTAEAAFVDEKKREAENIATDIAKTYLVAKTNAEAACKAAHETSLRAEYEVGRTLEAIKKIHERINSVKAEIATASDDYTAELENAISSFENAKSEIENAKSKTVSKVQE